jgi:hypothetical protein
MKIDYTNNKSRRERMKKVKDTSRLVPPYPLIYYPRFQLSAVYRGPPKKFENSINKRFISFKNASQARTGRNTVKSSSPNAHST